MIYLTTGANGTGKTLLTLRDVRERELKDVRPVAYNGRFDLVAEFNWKKIDAKDWQAEPDGTIFLFDEAHNDFPAMPGKGDVPQFISALGEHRRRGFDFYLITQHPMNLHSFIRRIVGDPGWHRHLKRAAGAPLVSVAKWPSVKEQPQKHGASADAGDVQLVPYPREVYKWYNSATLHTAKVAIPLKVKMGIAALLAIPVLGYMGYKALQRSTGTGGTPAATAPAQTASAPVQAPARLHETRKAQSPEDYVSSFRPRVSGLAYTASRYDDVTKPTVAPFPAACVHMGDRCDCYSQQATKLLVPADLCLQIVKNGYFQDWGDQRRPEAVRTAAAAPGAEPLQQVAQLVPAATPQVAGQAAPAPSPAPMVARVPRRPGSAPH